MGSQKPAEKICSQSSRFMQYHSLTAVPGEERSSSWQGGGPETKCRSEDDLDVIRSATGDTGPRRREGFTAGEVKRGGYCEALVY